MSADLGASPGNDLPLLGVDFVIVGLLASPPLAGTTISEGVIASAQGLFEVSSWIFLVLLSVLLSRILFGSPLTCCERIKPDELEPELDESAIVLELTLEVSIVNPKFGDLPRIVTSSSTQPAGVGGIGPKVDSGPGLRVGGEITRSVAPVMLCDLEFAGGGPGGGGGSGIPGSHLVLEDPRDCEEDDVLIAPVEAALREAGGLESTSCK